MTSKGLSTSSKSSEGGYFALHIHDSYSLLDGFSDPEEYFIAAQELGIQGLGFSNHGSAGGFYKAHKLSKKYHIPILLGIEFYYAPEGRFQREPIRWGQLDGKTQPNRYTHLTVFAKNSEGLRNLYRLSSVSYEQGFYGKPRIDFEVLQSHADGLVVLSGCASGEISTRLRLGQFEEALGAAERLKGVFGEDFYIEMMYHGLDFERDLNTGLLEVSQRLKIPAVFSVDAHYANPNQKDSHDSFLCLQTKTTKNAERRFRFDGGPYHLSSFSGVQRLSQVGGIPETAIRETLAIGRKNEGYDDLFDRAVKFPKATQESLREVSLREKAQGRLKEVLLEKNL